MLVEVNVDSDLPRQIIVEDGEGGKVTVEVEYPWIPVKCSHCKNFGPLELCL